MGHQSQKQKQPAHAGYSMKIRPKAGQEAIAKYSDYRYRQMVVEVRTQYQVRKQLQRAFALDSRRYCCFTLSNYATRNTQ